jgi:pimeloyl-ACP methyl ester carboxylesterase
MTGVTAALPRVVLVHGTRDDAAGFDRVVELLDDLTVVRYTRRGWGEEDVVPEGGASLDVHVDDLLDILGDEPSVVVGHSFGGNVAIPAALRRPHLVLALGLWETTLLWHPEWPAVTADALRATIARVRSKDGGSSRQHRHRALFVAEGEIALSAEHDLASLSVPTVIAIGEHSVRFFGEGTTAVARSLGIDHLVVPGAGHLAHRDQPEAFATFVREVVDRASLAH